VAQEIPHLRLRLREITVGTEIILHLTSVVEEEEVPLPQVVMAQAQQAVMVVMDNKAHHLQVLMVVLALVVHRPQVIFLVVVVLALQEGLLEQVVMVGVLTAQIIIRQELLEPLTLVVEVVEVV
jgi:hypothetical protein